MTKWITSIFIVFINLNLTAQSPDYFGNNPQWSSEYQFPGAGGDPYQDKIINYLSGTEIIDGNTYHLMFVKRFRHEGWGGGEFELLDDLERMKVRQEGRKIYYYNNITETDSLLLSYELEIGDELVGESAFFFPSTTITDVDSILVGGEYRRVLYFDGPEENTRFIEGISYLWGELDDNFGTPFNQMEILDYDPAFDIYRFNCYSENGSPLWKPIPETICDFELSTADFNFLGETLIFYPNPATTHVTIEFNETMVDKIEILNLVGQVLTSYLTTASLSQIIDLESLPKGLYVLQFSTNGNVMFQKKLTKQ